MPLTDTRLDEFATPRQKDYLEAVRTHKTQREAAKALGISLRVLQRGLKTVRDKAAQRGYSPKHNMTRTVPEGFLVKGVSTYYDKEGNPKGQWVKSAVDRTYQIEFIQTVYEALAEDLPRVAPTKRLNSPTNEDLLNCYVITDYHLGAFAWEPETGAEWNIELAERTLVAWFEQAIAQSPNAKTALLAQISDFLHWDGFEAVTPASRNLLDADGRFPNLVRVAIRVLRQVITMLLEKHEKVHIIMADANHDPVSQVWLREWLAVLYEDEPRVIVDTSPSPYNAYEFGKVAIFAHHGHKRGVNNIAEVFAAQFRELFGRTKYAYAHIGHRHHVDIKENNLMIVEQHRTLAAADAYTARGGWISGRDAQVITYHKEYGEVGRVTISYDAIANAHAA